MTIWKIGFLSDGKTIATAGELGKLYTFDSDTQENVNIIDTNDIFSSALATVK